MAWNGRMVKTYGRHKRRMIKSEAWISPDLKSSAAKNVFSSPDTDVNVESLNGSLDGPPPNGSYNKQSGKMRRLLEIVEESDKENLFPLAADTPEDDQGTRRRTFDNTRNFRVRSKRGEGTLKLFSSDSDDDLRKAVGRRAHGQVFKNTDTNIHKSAARKGRAPSQDQPNSKPTTQQHPKKSAKSKRVKNVIENDVFTVIRSPPPRGHRSSKRRRSDESTSSNASMSPFAIMESWIDSVTSSTPLVELETVNAGDAEVLCTKRTPSGCYKCREYQGTEDVTRKLCQLVLSDNDGADSEGGSSTKKASLRSRKTPKDKEEIDRGKRSLRNRGRSVNYKDVSDEEDKLGGRGKRRTKNLNTTVPEQYEEGGRGQRRTKYQNTTVPEQYERTGTSFSADCSVVLSNCSCNEIEANLSGPVVVLKGLSHQNISPHLLRSSVVLKSLSPHELEFQMNSSDSSNERVSTESPSSSNDSISLRPLSRKLENLHLGSGADYAEDEGEVATVELPVSCRRMKTCSNSSKEVVSSAYLEEHVVEEPDVEMDESPVGSRRVKICSTSSKEDDECDVPVCPTTPRSKRLDSFHADSFKEVFTPKKHKDTGLIVTGKEKVLEQCGQTEPVLFTHCIKPAMLRKCTKIGEGVYGEVFRTVCKRQSVALKIIPIEGDFEVNEEPQKTFDEILPEIVISRELSYLANGDFNYSNNYIHVNSVSCCRGRYPKELLKQWDSYNERKESENDRPDIFDDEQLFIVFEFADGGQDLEGFEFDDLKQAVTVLQQVAGGLAVAEQELEFEHRDLHWGNVLIRATKQELVEFRLGGIDYCVVSHGFEVSIIDFTLSRLNKDGCTIFCDLAADPTLFDGTGDYQFDIYRKMKKKNNNNWEPFNPHTNVLWLHYVADKLLNTKTYRESNTKQHKSLLAELRSFSRHLHRYASAEEVVRESSLFTL